jgi:hypothetical protein
MVRKFLIVATVITALVLTASAAFAAPKPGAHWVTEPVCTVSGDGSSVSCTSGSVAGLGNEPVMFTASVPAGCSTRPDSNNPPGHAQFGPIEIQPRGGRINTPAFTLSADCPPGLNSFVGDEVTFTIFRSDGSVVFEDVIVAS